MAYRLVRTLVYTRGVFFFPPSRVVAASRCTEFCMAAVVAASDDRWGRVFAMGRAAGVGGGAR
eukprot:scaffold3630_cov65-Phaeocystis_antarctica.AAC.1